MKHAGGEQSGGARQRAVDEMAERADAAGGHHRHPHRAAHASQQLEVEAGAGAVLIHAGQEQLAGP